MDFSIFVWYFISARKKGVSKKLQAKWDGPYKILDKLSDVTYRIRKGKQTKPKVVHFDKIKPFKGKLPVGWSRIPETLISEVNDGAEHSEIVTPDALSPDSSHMVEKPNTPESSFGRKLNDQSWLIDFET